MKKYNGYSMITLISSLFLTNVTLKLFHSNNILVDLVVYLLFASLCTALFILFDKNNFRSYLKFW